MNLRAVSVVVALLASLYLVMGVSRADDRPQPIYIASEECEISTELKASGVDTTRCVEYLETAARLAKAELRVNKGRRKARR